MLVDVDRFRQINDSLGHDVGDEVLRTVAQRIQTCLRDSDEIARVGGKETSLRCCCPAPTVRQPRRWHAAC